MWSDCERNQKKNRRKNKKGSVSAVETIDAPQDANKPELSEGGGDIGSSTYRLEVTDNGTAVLKRGDFEVVWQALEQMTTHNSHE